MATLRQLAVPHDYRACEWDLAADPSGCAAWVGLFVDHVDDLLAHTREAYPDASSDQIACFRDDYLATMRSVVERPREHGRVDILRLDELRESLCGRHGFLDPYHPVKSRANAAALRDLPRLLDELDAADPQREVELLAAGLMAGNLFDLGAKITMDQYRESGHDFWRSRATLAPRPWFCDHVDEWRSRWAAGRTTYRHAVIFVDNAGGDVCLGCLPLARWMTRHGTRVTLAANHRPALNDITADELVEMLAAAATMDDALARAISEDMLTVAATGTGAPLLDLAALTPEFVSITADADLLLFHGMGRSLESNRETRFSCDVLRTAVVKDALIAARIGARLMDCIFRFVAT